MSEHIEGRLVIRAEMAQLLIELSTARASDDLKIYSIIVVTSFAAVFIWCVGQPSSVVILALSILGMTLGLLLLLADKFSLAAKVKRIELLLNERNRFEL